MKKRSSKGGITTGKIRRRAAIKKYYKNPRICRYCNKIIKIRKSDKVTIVKKRHFCNSSCFGLFKSHDSRDKILKLFYEGKKYSQIAKILKCSKSIISYYCSKLRTKDTRYTDANLEKYQRHYDTYGNLKQTAEYFNVSAGTLKSYLVLKGKKFTPEEMKDRRKKQVVGWRRRTKIRAIEYKGGECQNCGYKKSVYCLDFHHINPDEKEFGIASSKVNNWERIRVELDKCILVCRNCHGELHEEIHLKGESEILKKIIRASG